MNRAQGPILRIAGILAVVTAAGGCPTEKPPAPKACCEQPKIPAGVTPFVVVADDTEGPSDGEKVKMDVGLSRPAKRDEIYPVLQTLYVHAMKRRVFEPLQFTARLYTTESAARTGGDQGLVGRIVRDQADLAPRCENKIPYDFAEQVAQAFAGLSGRAQEEDEKDTCHIGEKKKVARVDDTFTHRASYKLDAARKSVELTYPYLEMGKDEYAKDLKFNSAMREWIDTATTFFRKVDGLAELTFIGLSGDRPVVKITTTRKEFDGAVGNLQETIASHANVTFASLGMHTKDDKGASREQDAFQKKTYKDALALLPRNQVSVSTKLK
jgi:hypothetical protein